MSREKGIHWGDKADPPTSEVHMDKNMLDRLDIQPEFIGTCAWCSEPVYDDERYVDGDDGEGIMHAECGPNE